MNETLAIGLDIYLLGLIAFLLIILLFMVRRMIVLLASLQDRREPIVLPQTAGFDRSTVNADCTEEELAAITTALAQILPDNSFNIVNLKLIR